MKGKKEVLRVYEMVNGISYLALQSDIEVLPRSIILSMKNVAMKKTDEVRGGFPLANYYDSYRYARKFRLLIPEMRLHLENLVADYSIPVSLPTG